MKRQIILLASIFCASIKANPLMMPELKDPKLMENLKTSYQQNCSHCHSGSAPSAPRFGDSKEWSKRLEGGFNRLYQTAINGVPNTAMQAKGGNKELTNEEIKNLVNYLLITAQVNAKSVEAALKYDELKISDQEFIELDHAKRGYIEKATLKNETLYLSKFQQFDGNGDGRLDEVEFLKMRAELLQLQKSIKVSDEQLQKAILDVLSKVKGMPAAGIRVAAKNGSVTIQGVVGDTVVLGNATHAIRWLPGIQHLDNRLMTAEMLAFD